MRGLAEFCLELARIRARDELRRGESGRGTRSDPREIVGLIYLLLQLTLYLPVLEMPFPSRFPALAVTP